MPGESCNLPADGPKIQLPHFMVFTIFIAFFSLISLIILHEFGHFILAKKFGVKVEEFGIGIPPKIFGKKIGETIYSLNLLPFGAFVKLYGEDAERPEERIKNLRSFSQKTIWQRALIIFGGVVSFWIISFLVLSFVPTGVAISVVQNNSPAAIAGLGQGDIIEKIKVNGVEYLIFTIEETQKIIQKNRGKEIDLVIQRGKKRINLLVIPRVSPPPGEGALGIGLSYGPAQRSYPLYQAPARGFLRTVEFTFEVLKGWGRAIFNAIKGVPTGVQVMGLVGIFSLFVEIAKLGSSYFLLFLALISIYIALFNLLPIPALDGGKLLFLGIEAIRKKPIPQKIEKRINAFFFTLLIFLMIWVTIKDIAQLF